jgi:autotransporter translocation and assembly factor TamB
MSRIAANALSQLLLSQALNRIAPKIGLDVAKIGIDDISDEEELRAQAELGKYITERLYVGYRRIFGATERQNINEALMEYRISMSWLLSMFFGDAGMGELNLLWTHSW